MIYLILAQENIEMILRDFEDIEDHSCIRFKRREYEIDFIDVENGDGCSSFVGRQGGKQVVSLNNTNPCFVKGTAAHEALHVLGFYHQMSHPDRDNFVKIVWENIPVDSRMNFVKQNCFSYFNTSYDFHSIMHYKKNSGSKNGNLTIIPHDKKFLDIIGKSDRLSVGDIFWLNRMYECSDSYTPSKDEINLMKLRKFTQELAHESYSYYFLAFLKFAVALAQAFLITRLVDTFVEWEPPMRRSGNCKFIKAWYIWNALA